MRQAHNAPILPRTSELCHWRLHQKATRIFGESLYWHIQKRSEGTRSLHRNGADQKGFGIFQQAFCNAKFAFVRTNALLATTMRPFCPQFVIFRLEKKAMEKTKAEEKALNLDQILFNCRDYLRAARNSGSFFEKRDIPRSTAPKFSKRSWNR